MTTCNVNAHPRVPHAKVTDFWVYMIMHNNCVSSHFFLMDTFGTVQADITPSQLKKDDKCIIFVRRCATYFNFEKNKFCASSVGLLTHIDTLALG